MMKKKTNNTNELLDKLATTLDEKTIASKKLKQSDQEIEKLGNSLKEPARKAIEHGSDAQLARTQLLEIVEKVEQQKTILKSLQPTEETNEKVENPKTILKSLQLAKETMKPLVKGKSLQKRKVPKF